MAAFTGMDLASIPDDSVEELHRQAEKSIEGTIQFAVASDSRAATLTGVFGGTSIAGLAALATIVTSLNAAQYHKLICPSAAAIMFLFVAAILCALACRPNDFHVAGYQPAKLSKSAASKLWMLRYATADLQIRITANRISLQRSARLTTAGMLTALASVPIAALIYLAAGWLLGINALPQRVFGGRWWRWRTGLLRKYDWYEIGNDGRPFYDGCANVHEDQASPVSQKITGV